jgi:hypothetical protein
VSAAYIARLVIPFTLGPLVLAAVPFAHAATRARIVATAPSDGSTLGRYESLYVRVEYDTDEAVTLWARPYLRGIPVADAMSNGSPKFTGSGEALGWFALTRPGDVDEVRIRAGGGTPYREWDLASQPLRVRWEATAAPRRTLPPWVDVLRADSVARMRDNVPGRPPRSDAGSGDAGLHIFNGFALMLLATLLAGIVMPLRSVWRWRGAWRLAAAAPIAAIAFVALRIIVDTWRDPTSHNLWPFEILMVGLGALGANGVLILARRVLGVQA